MLVTLSWLEQSQLDAFRMSSNISRHLSEYDIYEVYIYTHCVFRKCHRLVYNQSSSKYISIFSSKFGIENSEPSGIKNNSLFHYFQIFLWEYLIYFNESNFMRQNFFQFQFNWILHIVEFLVYRIFIWRKLYWEFLFYFRKSFFILKMIFRIILPFITSIR